MLIPRPYKLNVDLCAYCGLDVATTDDHVVPRALWPKEQRNGVPFIRVPACSGCNSDKSKVDNFLRDYLVIDEDGSRHPLARALMAEDGNVPRAVEGGHVKILQRFDEGLVLPRVTPSGIIWGSHFGIPLDHEHWEKIASAVDFISRGLYWLVVGEAISHDMVVRSTLIPRDRRLEMLDRFGLTARVAGELYPGAGDWIDINDVYTGFMAAASGGMFWHHGFYNGVTFISRIGPIDGGDANPTVDEALLKLPSPINPTP